MKTILVAVDGSEPSLKGVQYAAQVSRALDARLELVYVVPPVLLPPTVYAETITKIEEGNRLHAQAVLKKAAQVAKDAGAECDTVTLAGAPAEALVDLAKADRVWGLVVGARGHNALSRVMLGSVADRIVHLCPKPVLVVR